MRVSAGEQISLIDIPISKVYVPLTGFDDNDAVEVVVEGTLPNPCYTLGKTLVGPVFNGTLNVRQLAWKNSAGPCGGVIEDPIPFTSVGGVGMLGKGEYALEFHKKDTLAKKNFQVAHAATDSIDNFNYAAIESIELNKTYYEGEEVFAELNGVWTTKCQQLQDPVKIERQGDLILVLPVLDTPHEMCERVFAPLHKKVSLGVLESGTYLIHSRSRGGKAIYKPFQVWPHLP